MELALPLKIILAFLLGGVIGLEREINERKVTVHHEKPTAPLGLRTFSIVTGMGAIAGILYQDFPALSILFAASFVILLSIYYVLDSIGSKDIGMTTELAILFSFLIGILIAIEIIPLHFIIALTVVLILLLSRKHAIKTVVEEIQQTEVNAFVGFAIIAAVILPFLPNTTYSLSDAPLLLNIFKNFGFERSQLVNLDLFNPFTLWLIVVLITGVDFLGYILEKTFGKKKGWLVASAAGGFISSTSTTQTLAVNSKHSKKQNHFVAAAVVANLVSFIQIGLLIAPLNGAFFASLLPILFMMILTAGAITYYFLKKDESDQKNLSDSETEDKEIFNFASALKFAVLFLIINIVSKLALTFFGNSGFLAATGIGSFIGLDAVIINTAQLVGKSIDASLGVTAFILANAVNLGVKTIYSFVQGNREFAQKFGISVAAIIIVSIITSLIF
jgi:uncharacterized membrane protein (DUF4010 family)